MEYVCAATAANDMHLRGDVCFGPFRSGDGFTHDPTRWSVVTRVKAGRLCARSRVGCRCLPVGSLLSLDDTVDAPRTSCTLAGRALERFV